ncbi:mannose-1-phosphate guanylyltransferase/mannose-6-phosphate isomerase [Ectothiorhodospiraceae bacterium WFHF3C12]|nr:mannose-1-phosphate guanylyltransferase/mannose-6-phosphate isomerase [Ectothiorhodospiraceae bacterium WFHF3C12]
MLYPVLLCGGSGTRLWPLSRQLYPKQFLPLVSERSMLQDTVARYRGLDELAEPIAVCNAEHRFLVAQQLAETGASSPTIILEPVGRNTAPAVAAAAICALREDADAVLLVMPSDHRIADEAAFRAAVEAGLESAADGKLVTFGIQPTGPETGYGYIRAESGQSPVRGVAEFVEKPDRETAESYLASGEYFWNSGIFLLGARRYLEELGRLQPEMLESCERAVSQAKTDLDFLRLDEAAFSACPSDSIDYAVMEKTRDAAVVPVDCGWSDLGSWAALRDNGDRDSNGNVLVGDVFAEDSRNSYIRSEGRLIAAIGIDNHVIVETPDAILVADADRVQDVKRVVEHLHSDGRTEGTTHKRVYRPWGSYETIAGAERFQVKRIIVNPGQQLSLQMHHHRAEHWVVVSGSARVTRGEETFLLTEDQSTYIPLGTVHRLENPGVIPLELIEVQSGSYLGEDDIVRFNDVYGRADSKETAK